MTPIQRSFVRRTIGPLALYFGGLGAVAMLSLWIGRQTHALGIDLLQAGFSYAAAIAVFWAIARAIEDVDAGDRAEPAAAAPVPLKRAA